jgi:KTSC domain-containing protein
MEGQSPQYKMTPVEADLIESIGFSDETHTLCIKFRNSPTLCFEKVPRFRYQGLLAAPRKDAYYRTFIQNQFLSKPVPVAM